MASPVRLELTTLPKGKKAGAVSIYGQLSYGPAHFFFKKMVSPVRLELTTPCLKGRCSNLLSYGPNGAIILQSETKSRVGGTMVEYKKNHGKTKFEQ